MKSFDIIDENTLLLALQMGAKVKNVNMMPTVDDSQRWVVELRLSGIDYCNYQSRYNSDSALKERIAQKMIDAYRD